MLSHQAKQQKLQEAADELSLDPMENILPELHDLIFQHLTGSEMIKCSTLSTTWNKSFSTSRQAMSRIKVCLLTSERWETSNIERRYKNARVVLQDEPESCVVSFLKDKRITLHLENLELLGDWKLNLHFSQYVAFPPLKSLKMKGLGVQAVQTLLGLAPDCLRELEIELEVMPESLLFFINPMPPLSAKITSLNLQICLMVTEGLQPNVINFLRSMSSTLKSLTVQRLVDDTFEFVLKEMKALEVLSIWDTQWKVACDTRNQSISTLELKKDEVISFFSPDVIALETFQNLQTLKLDRCNTEILEKVLKQCKDGQRVEIKWCRGSQSPFVVYENLLHSDPSIPRNVTIVHECSEPNCCRL
jgi:hypothetical protein